MARAAIKLSVRDVAALAQVSPNTVTRVEADLPVNTSTLLALRSALEAAGVEFRPDGFVGLSGSPVLDAAGQVVGVHHGGIKVVGTAASDPEAEIIERARSKMPEGVNLGHMNIHRGKRDPKRQQ